MATIHIFVLYYIILLRFGIQCIGIGKGMVLQKFMDGPIGTMKQSIKVYYLFIEI